MDLNDIRAAEQLLSVTFPDDYRDWLLSTNGLEKWFGEVYLMLYSLDDVIGLAQAADTADRLPGFVAIGSDGGGEQFAFDFRSSSPPVVMVNSVTAGWHEGLFQARSFSEFMSQRESGQDLFWTGDYR